MGAAADYALMATQNPHPALSRKKAGEGQTTAEAGVRRAVECWIGGMWAALKRWINEAQNLDFLPHSNKPIGPRCECSHALWRHDLDGCKTKDGCKQYRPVIS
jgi:hypothetical protein